MVPVVMRGQDRVNISISASMGKIFENLSKKPQSQKKFKFTCKVM
jgi:hypothetical protein